LVRFRVTLESRQIRNFVTDMQKTSGDFLLSFVVAIYFLAFILRTVMDDGSLLSTP